MTSRTYTWSDQPTEVRSTNPRAKPEEQVSGEVGEVVGPDAPARSGQTPARIVCEGTEVRTATGHDSPNRRLLAAELVVGSKRQVVADPTDETGVARQGAQNGVEVDVAVRDVEGEDPSRSELVAVELQCFARQQMGGNGVSAEGVEDHDPELVRGRFVKPQSRVADDDLERSGTGVLEEREIPWITGDPHDGRINLIKRPALVGLGVASKGAGAETGDRHARRSAMRAKHVEHLSNRPGAMEIRLRFPPQRGVEALLAVKRPAVEEAMAAALRVFRDLEDTEEVADLEQHPSVQSGRQTARGEDGADRECEPGAIEPMCPAGEDDEARGQHRGERPGGCGRPTGHIKSDQREDEHGQDPGGRTRGQRRRFRSRSRLRITSRL